MSNKSWGAILVLAALAISLGVAISGAYANGDQDQAPRPGKPELKYPNLGSQLNDLAVRVEDGAVPSEDPAGDAQIQQGPSVAVTIHLSGHVVDVAAFLEDNGGDPRNVGEDYIEAYVPVTLLGQVSLQPGVIRVREIVPPEPDYGPITSQGVWTHRSAAWPDDGYTGRGIKVGIIDGGFEGFASLMGTELPASVRARCYTEVGLFTSNLADCGNNTQHGTAAAENVMDVAPEVSLYIATHRSPGDFRDTVDWMISEGVSVINRSLGGRFEGPGDGTSPITNSVLSTIDRAVEGGIIFLNSAGNQAESSWFQGSPPSVYDPDGDGFGLIEFADSDTGNSIQLREGREVWIYLRWEDTWPLSSTDLDLFVSYLSSGEAVRVRSSRDPQSGGRGHFPTEQLYFVVPRDGEYQIEVSYESGALPSWIQLTAPKAGTLEHYTEGYSINGPSESANSGMLAVGATHYWDTHTIADYSSRGPTPDIRVKPDIVGTACGQAASYEGYDRRQGFRCWYSGTSSASPHVAGLAALVRQRFPHYTPEQAAGYLKDNAKQRETPDPNNTWGHGLAQLPSAQIPEALRERERADLVAFYNATGGPNWANNANWINTQPVGSWHGVTTNPSGQVVGLYIPENGLTGEIPFGLGNIANLTWMGLGGNELRGEIPPELGNLAGLTVLWLQENQLTGPIPVGLDDLSNLGDLNLWGNQLTGPIPAGLGGLANLERLSLGGNQLTGPIPAGLGGLASLERLSLWGNQLTGPIPAELGGLANLEWLYLSENRLTGGIPTELGNLATLERLYLWGNQLTGPIPPELGSLANLQELSLSENRLTGGIPTELGNLSGLTVLYLGGNQLTGCVPAALREVPDNDFTGLGLDFCAEVPGAPMDLRAAVSETEARVVLSWSAPSSSGGAPITGYLIESSVDGSDPQTEVFTTTGTATSYTDDGTDANGPAFGTGATQYYRVRAINSGGAGPPSNVALAFWSSALGDFTSQGILAHHVPPWHAAGIRGQGVKVGIIAYGESSGFLGYQSLMGRELPATVTARCYTGVGRFTADVATCDDGSDYGTNMAESLVDIAPQVSLYIANPGTRGDLSSTVDWMISHGVSVINHQVVWTFEGPGDGKSPFSDSSLKSVDRAVDAGIVWVNPAGGFAKKTWFTGTPANEDNDGWLDFRGGGETNGVFLESGETIRVQLRWEGEWGQQGTDLNLFLYDPGLVEVVASGADYQWGPMAGSFPVPWEWMVYEVPADGTYHLAIEWAHGTLPDWVQLMVWDDPDEIEHHTFGGSIANPAESANPGLLAVGAAGWSTPDIIKTYSSRGPTPDRRIKPDVVGATCGETSRRRLDSYGNGSCGTYPAAAHVAGMAALVRQRFPSMDPTAVVSYLKEHALQRRSPDPNNTWGNGLAQFPAPIPPDPPTVTVRGTYPDQVLILVTPAANEGIEPTISFEARFIPHTDDSTVEANWEHLSVGVDGREFSLGRLLGNTTYRLQMRAINAWGPGLWSPEKAFTTEPPVPPAAPLDLTASVSATEAKVELSWSPPASSGGAPVTGYLVELSSGAMGPWELVAETADNSYVDDGTDANGPVFSFGNWPHYRVAASNHVGTGPFSDPVFGGGDPLFARYDTNRNGRIDRSEVIAAINEYLFGTGETTISRADVIQLINLYLFG